MDEPYVIDKIYKKRMFLSGINLVGGLTDISNYLLFDVGQPNHFFSQNKLNQLSTDTFTIDRTDIPLEFGGLGQLKSKNLPVNTIILKDQDNHILAVPGISGGESTKMEVEETSSIIEIANFDKEAIARSSFALKHRSDGSKVWAGSVNSNLILVTILRLIEVFSLDRIKPVGYWDKQKGNVNSIEDFFEFVDGRIIEISIAELVTRIDSRGEEFWDNVIRAKLNLIGQYSDGVLKCEPFYSNLENKEDVFEEVVRLIGFDDIVSEPITSYSNNVISPSFESMKMFKNIWHTYGFNEVILRPFVGVNKLFDPNQKLELVKSYRTDEPFLRDSLLTSLATSLSSNLKKGQKTVRIFESNKVHSHQNGSLVDKIYVDGLMVEKDPYVATSLVNSILKSLGSSKEIIIEELALDEAQIGQGYLYRQGNIEIKLIQISNKFKKKYDISLSKSLWWISCDLTAWDYRINKNSRYTDESNYPSIKRSYSLLVDKKVGWAKLEKKLNSLVIFDVDFYVQPSERFEESEQTDILNFEIDFESLGRTINSHEIESFEEEMEQELSKLGKIKKR
ncbi:hypothetical protein HC864_03175 [Candidatus Gracilibacteria bacterium]|nr:hypothetical protein [Candidatus Gracilibacteria bacterium]